MLFVYVIDDGESTGMITSPGETPDWVRFPDAGAEVFTQAEKRQNVRSTPAHRTKKIPVRRSWCSTFLVMVHPKILVKKERRD